jgi:hypothetical protein
MHSDYFLGLDLGQTTDFTAVAVLERPTQVGDGKPNLLLRHLQRFALGTPYTSIVSAVAQLSGTALLRDQATMTVDQTGVGRPLVEMLRQAPVPCRIVPVTITGGNAVTVAEDGGFHVPKKELVTGLQLLLQGRRLKVARRLPDTNLLVRELLNFRVKITAAANETFGSWREGDHDDLVLAVALACWQAERDQPWPERPFGGGNWNSFDDAPEGVFLTGEGR